MLACLCRLSSTAACIFGVLLENEPMVTKLQKWTEGDNNPICALGQILTKHDTDIVMNATGAIASLVRLHYLSHKMFTIWLLATHHSMVCSSCIRLKLCQGGSGCFRAKLCSIRSSRACPFIWRMKQRIQPTLQHLFSPSYPCVKKPVKRFYLTRLPPRPSDA